MMTAVARWCTSGTVPVAARFAPAEREAGARRECGDAARGGWLAARGVRWSGVSAPLAATRGLSLRRRGLRATATVPESRKEGTRAPQAKSGADKRQKVRAGTKRTRVARGEHDCQGSEQDHHDVHRERSEENPSGRRPRRRRCRCSRLRRRSCGRGGGRRRGGSERLSLQELQQESLRIDLRRRRRRRRRSGRRCDGRVWHGGLHVDVQQRRRRDSSGSGSGGRRRQRTRNGGDASLRERSRFLHDGGHHGS